jgi:hypothetical protein
MAPKPLRKGTVVRGEAESSSDEDKISPTSPPAPTPVAAAASATQPPAKKAAGKKGSVTKAAASSPPKPTSPPPAAADQPTAPLEADAAAPAAATEQPETLSTPTASSPPQEQTSVPEPEMATTTSVDDSRSETPTTSAVVGKSTAGDEPDRLTVTKSQDVSERTTPRMGAAGVPRRRHVRQVEVAAAPPTLERPKELTPQHSPSRATDHLHAGEDEFGDVVLSHTSPEVNARVDGTTASRGRTDLDDALSALNHIDASEPEMAYDPAEHRRNLMAFADPSDHRFTSGSGDAAMASTDKGRSPEAAGPDGSESGSFLDKLKKRLRSVSVSSANNPGNSIGRADDDDQQPPSVPSTGPAAPPPTETPLALSVRRLKGVTWTKPVEVLAHYRPSQHPNRCEQFRSLIGTKLKNEVAPPPEIPTLSTPPPSLGAAVREQAAAQEATAARALRLPHAPLVFALQDVKRVHLWEALRHAEGTLHRHVNAAEKRGHMVMQVKANADAVSGAVVAIANCSAAMREGLCPYFSPARSLVVQ